MKLYYSPGACSLAPHILLIESGMPFSLERVDTKTHTTKQGEDYYQINPKGSVPLLELENGERLSEGPIVAQYICDTAKRDDLMPAAGTMARYRVMEWQNYITSELHKSFSPLFNPATPESDRPTIQAALTKKFRWVNEQLKGKKYLTGDNFTAADAYLFTVAGWAKYVGPDLSEFTSLRDYLARIAERPAVLKAMKAEGLLS